RHGYEAAARGEAAQRGQRATEHPTARHDHRLSPPLVGLPSPALCTNSREGVSSLCGAARWTHLGDLHDNTRLRWIAAGLGVGGPSGRTLRASRKAVKSTGANIFALELRAVSARFSTGSDGRGGLRQSRRPFANYCYGRLEMILRVSSRVN